MTVQEIMADLEAHGSESIKKILVKHGVKEPFFGVKVEYLKPIQKKIKKDYQLAKDLYATGNADAMYLAGLIADDEKMSKADLQVWVAQAVSNNISEHTVPWVAAGSNHGYELAMEWIDSPTEHIATAGWCTLSNLVSLKPDNELDIPALRTLLSRLVETIHSSQNRVRNAMNGFMIAIGVYVPALTTDAIDAAGRVGIVMVDKGDTACKVPDAIAYITKAKDKGVIGKKKQTVKC
jgi:3-methyladenine DNA glycosylase AlkD